MSEFYVIVPNKHVYLGREKLYLIGIDEQWTLYLSNKIEKFDKERYQDFSIGETIVSPGNKPIHGCVQNLQIVGEAGHDMKKLAQAVFDGDTKAEWLPNMFANRGIKDYKQRIKVKSDKTVEVDPTLMFELFQAEGGQDWRPYRKRLIIVAEKQKASEEFNKKFNEEMRISQDICHFQVWRLVEHPDGWGNKKEDLESGYLTRSGFDSILKAFPTGKKVTIKKSTWRNLLSQMENNGKGLDPKFGITGSIEIEIVEEIHNWFSEDEITLRSS